jgi:hypothetical protein
LPLSKLGGFFIAPILASIRSHMAIDRAGRRELKMNIGISEILVIVVMGLLAIAAWKVSR